LSGKPAIKKADVEGRFLGIGFFVFEVNLFFVKITPTKAQ
jgi:hypothetical protein